MKVWYCKIGILNKEPEVESGADFPMRAAVERAFRDVTGLDAEFCFSGWGAELTEPELAVVEDREPRL